MSERRGMLSTAGWGAALVPMVLLVSIEIFIPAARMHLYPEDRAVQVDGCRQIFQHLAQSPNTKLVQNAVLWAGIPQVAIASMQRWPDDFELQQWGHKMLTQTAAWNLPTQVAIGKVPGIFEVAVANIRRFGLRDPETFIAVSGYYKDFNDENRYKFEALNGTDAVYELLLKDPNPKMQLSCMCFFSNACPPHDLSHKMAGLGYIQYGVRLMQDPVYRLHPGLRGETQFVLWSCFHGLSEYHATLVEEGFIEAVVSLMRDQDHSSLELDVAGSARLYATALRTLQMLAYASAPWLERALRAGAAEQILASLRLHSARGPTNTIPSIAMKESMLEQGCGALRALEPGARTRGLGVASTGALAYIRAANGGGMGECRALLDDAAATGGA